MARRLFTSESVTEGHPDKIADQISDTILDAMLKEDPRSRVAVETLITTGQVHVAGEVTTSGWVDIPGLVREKILEIGYDSSKKGFDGASCGVSVSIGSQSPDIAQGVDDALEEREGDAADELDRQGAGDQGLMFGYACDDTPELMPLPIHLAHNLARRLAHVRKEGQIPYLRPDGKTQVTIEYDDDDRAVRLDTIVVSSQHAADIDLATLLAPDIEELVVRPELADLSIDTDGFRLLVNPTGRFEIGGPMGDAGLTGRKIIVDTYGGMARHGGGAFSGKDPSKVDRSAAYAMRWVAKNVVAAGLARRCEVQVAYAIGKAHPVGVFVETFGTGVKPDSEIQSAVLEVFDLRPAAIIRDLDLLRPIYAQTAAYGHFGRDERRPARDALVPLDPGPGRVRRDGRPVDPPARGARLHLVGGGGARLRARPCSLRRVRGAGPARVAGAVRPRRAARRGRVAALGRLVGAGYRDRGRPRVRALRPRGGRPPRDRVVHRAAQPGLAGGHAAHRDALRRRLPPPEGQARRVVGPARALPHRRRGSCGVPHGLTGDGPRGRRTRPVELTP